MHASDVVFPEPVGAGDEHQTAVLLREPPHACRQVEVVEAWDLARDHAEGDRDRAALAEAVDAEARQLRTRVGDVEVAALVEGLAALGRADGDGVQGAFQVGVAEHGPVGSGSRSPSMRMIGGWPSFR